MKFVLLSDHLSPFFDGWGSNYNIQVIAYTSVTSYDFSELKRKKSFFPLSFLNL